MVLNEAAYDYGGPAPCRKEVQDVGAAGPEANDPWAATSAGAYPRGLAPSLRRRSSADFPNRSHPWICPGAIPWMRLKTLEK